MIIVTERVKTCKDNLNTENRNEVEYPNAENAWVNNGVLTLYPKGVTSTDFGQSIAAYEAGSWLSWRKK